MVTAFWSPNHGQTGTTTAALTMAVMTAITNNYKVLLGHSHFRRSTLERCLMPKRHGGDDFLSFSDNGMDALRRLAKNGRLMPEKVSDYTSPLLSGNRLDLLQGIEDATNVASEEETDVLRRIFAGARGAYDLVMIDVHSGSNQRLTRRILEDADLVVVCLNQNRWLLEDYFGDDENHQLLGDKKVIYHISMYTKDSKYSVKNLKKLYGLDTVIATPYSPELMDACNGGLGLDFFMRHLGCSRKDRFWSFMKEVTASTELFLSSLGEIDQEVMEEAGS